MKTYASPAIALFLSAALAAPVAAQPAQERPQLSLEHHMLLRCSAAFALVAKGQDTGDANARAYPPLAQTGREFFVRAAAQVMDEAGLARDAVSRELSAEAQSLLGEGSLARIMPACLSLLDDAVR